jgi:hypothetical protein
LIFFIGKRVSGVSAAAGRQGAQFDRKLLSFGEKYQMANKK